MKQLIDYILEKHLTDQNTKEEIEIPTKNTKWIAIEITTKNPSGWGNSSKSITSQRVVTVDTYNELKSKGYTKGYAKIEYIDAISPVCSSKDVAMDYIAPPQKTMRKSKIDKGYADYIVYCINSGKMNAAGRTNWESFPNFWETWKDGEIYMGRGGAGKSFLAGAKGSLKVGDNVFCVDNDTQKKLSGAPSKIDAVCNCNLEDFRKVFRETYPEICKSPKRAFGKVSDGLPWTNRMGQIYSIKGIEK